MAAAAETRPRPGPTKTRRRREHRRARSGTATHPDASHGVGCRPVQTDNAVSGRRVAVSSDNAVGICRDTSGGVTNGGRSDLSEPWSGHIKTRRRC
jgi:hypothetical protein